MRSYRPKYVEKILVTKKQVEASIKKAASWINTKFANSKEPPVLLCILKGATPFFGRLVTDVKIECYFDFMVLSSFRGQLQAMADPKVVTQILSDIKNRDVVIIEDVVDTARTISLLWKYLKDKGAKTVSTVVLVDKYEMRKVPYQVDYACFKIGGNPFLIGYGLDVKEHARNLPYIASFDKKYFDKL